MWGRCPTGQRGAPRADGSGQGAAPHPLGASASRQRLRIGCAVRNDEGAGRLVKETIVRHCHEQHRISSFRTAQLIRNPCLTGWWAELAEDEAQGRSDGEATAGRLIGNSVTGTEIHGCGFLGGQHSADGERRLDWGGSEGLGLRVRQNEWATKTRAKGKRIGNSAAFTQIPY
jgi:hypothetical protein